jgi:hypothetical protein
MSYEMHAPSMKRILLNGGVVGCLALALTACSPTQIPTSGADGAGPRRWQHLALEQDAKRPMSDPEFTKKINQLGDDGWELVAVDSVLDSGTTVRRIYFFKRLK